MIDRSGIFWCDKPESTKQFSTLWINSGFQEVPFNKKICILPSKALKMPQLSVTNDVSIDQQGRLLFCHKTRKGPRGVIIWETPQICFIYFIKMEISHERNVKIN